MGDGDFIYIISALLLANYDEAILWLPRSLRFDPSYATLKCETVFSIDRPAMSGSVNISFNGPLETGSHPPKLTRENK